MLTQNFRTALFAGLTLVVSTQLAVALDANDFAKKLTQAYAVGGAELSFDAVSVDGASITLKNMTMEIPGDEQGLNLGDMVFEGVKEDGSGGYNVASVTEDNFTISDDGFSFSINDIRLENLYVPAESTAETINNLFYYDRATTGPLVMTIDGRDLFKIASSETKMSKSSDGKGLSFDARAAGLEIDLSDVDDPQAQQAINGMGYQYLAGDMTMKGSWQLASGEIALDEYALTLNDVGRLDLKFSVSGYTLEFVQGLQKLQEQMSGKEDDAKAQQAMGFAMLGMMQQLTLNGLSIRFDDASLTNKVLDMVASQQGSNRQQMVQGLQAMLPFVLGRLKNPEFQKAVTEAASIYLADPKNIEISAAPENPLPFSAVAGSAMTAPETLPDVLNVTVMANQ